MGRLDRTRSPMGWLRALALASLAPVATAGDYYVDSVAGNNANSGASPGQAWRTITYALSRLPSPPTGEIERIHVAPGVHDAALGEQFPLVVQWSDVQILSTGGSAVTVLDGGGAPELIVCVRSFHSGVAGPMRRVEGFTVRNAGTGVLLGSSESSVHLTCRDLVLEGMGGWAVRVTAGRVAIPGELRATFESVRIRDCGVGDGGHAGGTTCQELAAPDLSTHPRAFTNALTLVVAP